MAKLDETPGQATGEALAEIARELYAVPPEEFTAARDRRAAEAKESGDAGLARALRKLRRPTNSAWLVNLLCRERGDAMAELLALAEQFHAEPLTGQRLRELSARRRDLVRGLLADVERRGAQAGVAPTAEVLRQVEATLGAAVADPASAEQVRSGRLDKPLSYVGFGPGVAVPEPDRQLAAVPRPAKPERAAKPDPAELAARRLAEAKAAVDGAERELTERAEALQAAVRERDEIREQRDQVRAELDRIRAELRDLETRFAAVDRGARAEAKRLERAEQQLSQARRRLADEQRPADK